MPLSITLKLVLCTSLAPAAAGKHLPIAARLIKKSAVNMGLFLIKVVIFFLKKQESWC